MSAIPDKLRRVSLKYKLKMVFLSILADKSDINIWFDTRVKANQFDRKMCLEIKSEVLS